MKTISITMKPIANLNQDLFENDCVTVERNTVNFGNIEIAVAVPSGVKEELIAFLKRPFKCNFPKGAKV